MKVTPEENNGRGKEKVVKENYEKENETEKRKKGK
jgi:hypothetical protein